ncbi:MAG: ABC transporter substrate-binding protein [Thermomicrobiales bacterium]|nr:ABC transporter substrate-binding protein [Thermomicrobiales bacterium]
MDLFRDTTDHTFARRTFVIGATGAAALMSQLGSAQNTEGEWSFTDDKGITVTLDTPPEVILMDLNVAAPLWDFGIKPDGLFGWSINADGSLGPAGGNVDGTDIPRVGNVNEPFQLEPAVNIGPDLILTLTWAPEVPGEYWSIEPELVEPTLKIAPIIALSGTGRADVNLLRFAELAGALGAELDSEEMIQAKADYEKALAEFTETVAKTDLVALFVYLALDETYIVNPPDWGDLNMFTNLGLTIVTPDVEQGIYFHEISNEVAGNYPADIIFVSTHDGRLTDEEIKAMPGWKLHPAVAAGQIFDWNQDFIQSYQGLTAALSNVTDAINASTKVM